jgi:class 3 adenylate cyclase
MPIWYRQCALNDWLSERNSCAVTQRRPVMRDPVIPGYRLRTDGELMRRHASQVRASIAAVTGRRQGKIMENALPSLQHLNRTLIGSVLFIDIVDYSERTVPEQIAMKELFIVLLAEAMKNVSASERIMVDTGDGAGVAFLDDPENALFAALSLRDAVDAGKVAMGAPGFVRMGINLGPLKVVRDINGHTNMIGDGVNDAERVMSFAEPGQVMVSRSYYDVVSRFSRDYSALFSHQGKRQDKHAREHEVYRLGQAEGSEMLTENLRSRSRARQAVEKLPDAACIASMSGNAQAPPPAARLPTNLSNRRYRLTATAIGVLAITGAVWSWTNTTAAQSGVPATGSEKSDARAGKAALVITSATAAAHASKLSPEADAPTKPATPLTSVATKADQKPAESLESNLGKGADILPEQKPVSVKLAIHPWGEIYVDGKKSGFSPPLRTVSLEPGKHRIEIRNSQFAPYKETIEVKSGAETTVQYTF